MAMGGRGLAVAATLIALGTAACSVPVAGALDERDANQVTVALQQAGVEASKEADPASEGHYRILVPRDDAPTAIATMREHDLPPRNAPGVADSLGKGAIVPSPLAEHAQFVAAVAGDLERTLATVDGVLAARVHLSIPHASPLSDKPAEKPSAAVLIKHAGSTPPISEQDVRRLVSGSVSSLPAESVTVVMISRASAAVPERSLAHFGPISVTRSSALWLRLHLGVTFAVLLGLVSTVVYLWLRLRRTYEQPAPGESR
jgi:type III secretion protein J